MLITLAYCNRDNVAARQLLEWINELGGCKNHELLILHDHRVDQEGVDGVKHITNLANQAFGKVIPIVGKASIDGWPQGANYFFRTISNVLSYRANEVRFFLWLEPDSIPLSPGWAEKLETEFIACKRPFMGDRVEVENIALHMSGVAVYPNPLHQFSGEAYRAADIAWDMAGKDEIVPKAHFTKLIEHAWKHPSFTDVSELKTQIRPEAVLFHASKDGSLINVLRKQMHDKNVVKVNPEWQTPPSNAYDIKFETVDPAPRFAVGEGNELVAVDPTLSVQEQRTPSDVQGKIEASPPTGEHKPDEPIAGRRDRLDAPSFTCDIFIRTYPADYPWLKYCLQSINKFCTGFRKIWIISPEESPFDMSALGYEWKQMNEETEDGYLSQQIHKLYADVITDYQADYILHVDSDNLFTQSTTPNDFVLNGKPIWFYTPYSAIEVPWQPITEKFMNGEVENEFMRRFPMMIPRWLYPRLREFCHGRHGMIISEYIRTQPYRSFSEYNALGAYAYHYHRDRFEFENTLNWPTMPAAHVRQFYSWGGITPEIRQEINTILQTYGINKPAKEQVREVATTRGGGTPGAPSSDKIPFIGTVDETLPGTAGPAVHSTVPSSSAQPRPRPDEETVPAQIEVLPNGIWVLKDDTHISKWVKQQGRLDHDMNSLPFILPLIKPGDHVIDAGAFIGDHTVAYAEAVGPEGIVSAFEPNPAAFQCLLHNVMGHGEIACYEMALGARNKTVSLHGDDNSGGVYVSYQPGVVEMVRLDGYQFSKVDLIKLDVEGCELDALGGAYETIMRCRPKMVIEINRGALERQGDTPEDVFRWLNAHGYRWWIMQENCSAADPMFDIICEPVNLTALGDGRPIVTPAPSMAALEMSVSIHDHVRALSDHMKKGKDARKYVRKLLRKEGVTTTTATKKDPK